MNRRQRPPSNSAWYLLMLCAVTLLVVANPVRAQQVGQRMAMVVGNMAYDSGPVPHAARDASDMADTLETLGFAVTLLLESDGMTLAEALDRFARQSEDAEAVVFYFSGYGVRLDGENHLLPTDAPLSDLFGTMARAVPLAQLLKRLNAPNRPTIALLDAGRALPVNTHPGIRPGLGPVIVGHDSFVATATPPDRIAPAKDTGRNSRFTHALIGGLPASGQPLSRIMEDLRDTVALRSDGQQQPWSRSTLSEPFFFKPFRPDDDDFNRLAAMPEAQQDFLLDIWRSQGASITREMIAAHQERAETAALTGTPLQPSSAPGSDEDDAIPRFTFELLDEEEDSPDTEQTTPDAVAIAVGPEAMTGPSPLLADAPISRVAALSPQPTLTQRQEGIARIVGKDITDSHLLPDDLPRAVQIELARLGCYTVAVDGLWGNGSRAALNNYIRNTGASLATREPTAEVWRNVKAASGQVCTSPPPTTTATTRTPASPSRQPARPQATAGGDDGSGANGSRLKRALGNAFR